MKSIFYLGPRSVLAAKLLGDSAGQAHGRYPAGLSYHDVAGLWHFAPGQQLLQQELRNLSTLTTACLTGHHHHRVALQSLQDMMPVLEDGKLLSLCLEGRRLIEGLGLLFVCVTLTVSNVVNCAILMYLPVVCRPTRISLSSSKALSRLQVHLNLLSYLLFSHSCAQLPLLSPRSQDQPGSPRSLQHLHPQLDPAPPGHWIQAPALYPDSAAV